MRPPSFSCSMWKRTSLCRTAVTTFTGTFTRPKLIEPLQIALAAMLSRFLPHHVVRVLVLAQPLEGRMAQAPVARPLGELHLADEGGLHEDGLSLVDGSVEGRAALHVLLQLALELVEERLREARAHASGVAQACA